MNDNGGTSKKILVAEDDEDHYLLIREAFETSDPFIKLHRVKDGEELMDYLLMRESSLNPPQASQPDVILLDLNMPRKDGREALKEIKSHPNLRTIPVVVLTTSKFYEDVLQSYQSGANSYLIKPLSFHQWVALAKIFNEYWFETVQLPPHLPLEGRHL